MSYSKLYLMGQLQGDTGKTESGKYRGGYFSTGLPRVGIRYAKIFQKPERTERVSPVEEALVGAQAPVGGKNDLKHKGGPRPIDGARHM